MICDAAAGGQAQPEAIDRLQPGQRLGGGQLADAGEPQSVTGRQTSRYRGACRQDGIEDPLGGLALENAFAVSKA